MVTGSMRLSQCDHCKMFRIDSSFTLTNDLDICSFHTLFLGVGGVKSLHFENVCKL